MKEVRIKLEKNIALKITACVLYLLLPTALQFCFSLNCGPLTLLIDLMRPVVDS
jgi:hypothetical protein